MLVSQNSRNADSFAAFKNTKLLATFLAALVIIPMLSTPVIAQDSDELPEGVAAIVNGRPIPAAIVDEVENQIAESEEKLTRSEILDELINLEVLTQRAEAQELDSNSEVAAALQLQYVQTMANAYIASLTDEIVVDDARVQQEYDEQVAQLERYEYRASHILLETEEDAVDVVIQLEDGAEFATVAKENSVGPSAADGGDLGWFNETSMVPEFSTAVTLLEKDEFTNNPVQTQYGWHVIKLIDKRKGGVPNFESVKEGIRSIVVRNMLNERIAELRGRAEIKR